MVKKDHRLVGGGGCGSMTGGVHKRKVDTRDELHTRILDSAAHTKKGEDQLREKQNAVFAYDLQSALKLTVGFSNVYCKL
jgi:hypothetical protein